MAELSLDSLSLEIEYNEKREAELVRKCFQLWERNKQDFKTIIEHIRKPASEIKKDRSYFG